ncbi:MAG: TIGR03905 family TSCPD domain-containing protein [Treponema sp.]|jgi:uncharacterized protein (TIGR03905 family)|nr:TIGR03905 family TSCPD domain-containing protein [Treponema sp.]
MFEYEPEETCSTKISFEIAEGKLRSVAYEDGCEGNLKALSMLVEGMDAAEVVKKFKGLTCEDRGTSCADQLARAVEKYL